MITCVQSFVPPKILMIQGGTTTNNTKTSSRPHQSPAIHDSRTPTPTPTHLLLDEEVAVRGELPLGEQLHERGGLGRRAAVRLWGGVFGVVFGG